MVRECGRHHYQHPATIAAETESVPRRKGKTTREKIDYHLAQFFVSTPSDMQKRERSLPEIRDPLQLLYNLSFFTYFAFPSIISSKSGRATPG